MKPGLISIVSILVLFCSAAAVHAHGGGTDKNGCHNDRKNGGYHCH